MLQGPKNVVVVEYGLKLRGEKGEQLVSSYSYFGGETDDKFKGGKTVSGIKYGKRQGPEGERPGITYGSGHIFRKSALGMELGTTMGS